MKNLDKAVMHCYRELYANSEPPASFDQLMEDAPTNEMGQKVIDYMAYSIDEELFVKIIKDTISLYKIKSPKLKRDFEVAMYLGAGPKFKEKGE
jgi:hypothetical protein